MKLSEFVDRLVQIQNKYGDDLEVDVLIETNEPTKCQYQYPANDIAVDKGDRRVIVMHEKWTGSDIP